MCAVVGYAGKSFCSAFILEGLARLQYRGYDSAGFACLDSISQKLLYSKSSGHLSNLANRVKQNPIDGFLGIGHTRWSTHGDVSEKNAHPHFDCSQTISVVHNGIIENYATLREKMLASGHLFHSETDTEVISHLCESLTEKISIDALDVAKLVQQLEGAYAFIVMLQAFPDFLIAVRKKSPLCIGVGEDEMFVASDMLAFSGKTNKVIFLPDETFAIVSCDNVLLYDFYGNQISWQWQMVDAHFEVASKGEHAHFMLKEIYEQKAAIVKTVQSLQSKKGMFAEQLGLSNDQLMAAERICFVACGTSWHAARIAQFFFESIAHVPIDVHVASEFRYGSFFPQKNTLYIFISQSGETADTLEALRMVNAHTLSTIALTNVATSTIVRQARGFFLTCAGPEIAVASTKAFSTQLAALYWLGHYVALKKGAIADKDLLQAEVDIEYAAELLEASIAQHKYAIDHIHAKRYAQYDTSIFVGRHISYPLAMEAALKLKEVAYVWAECYAAGELKHGPLALVDEHMLIYIFLIAIRSFIKNYYPMRMKLKHVVAQL